MQVGVRGGGAGRTGQGVGAGGVDGAASAPLPGLEQAQPELGGAQRLRQGAPALVQSRGGRRQLPQQDLVAARRILHRAVQR